MKKLVSLLALSMMLVATASSEADEPYLEFIRALRAKNYGDLALEYMDRLNTNKNIPPEVKAVFPIERARVRVDQARNTFNVAKRLTLIDQARGEFEAFVKNRPNDPYVTEASFETARLLNWKGYETLVRGQRGPEEAKATEFQKAFDILAQAKTELKAALAKIEAAQQKNPPEAVAKALTQAKFDCNLELNINLIGRAATYAELNKNLEEAAGLVKDAIAELKKLAAQDAKNSTCWLARVWAGKGSQELDTPNEAKKDFDAVFAEENNAITAPARRLARYFQFVDAMFGVRAKTADAVTIGEQWIKENPAHLNSVEGILIRYELAKIYEGQALAMMKDPKAPPDAKTKTALEKARILYVAMEDIDSDFSEDILRRKLSITSKLSGKIDVTKINELDSFDKAYDAMVVLSGELAQAPDDKERKRILEVVLKVLNRALDLTDDKAQPSKVAEVRSNLAYVYMALEEPNKAVVIGEDVAHRWSHQAKAAAGGAYALQAYSMLIAEGTANAAEPRTLQSDYDRMVVLVKFMEKTWPTDSNTDAARHQVGTLMLRQKKTKEAIEYLSRITDAYAPDQARTDARWWWAVACQQMLTEAIPDAEKKKYQAQALKALESIPEAGNKVHPEIAQMYVYSRLQIGQIYYETKQYDKLDTLAKNLEKRLPGFRRLGEGEKKTLKRTVDTLGYYAQYGKATQELNAGHATEARKIADPVLQRVSAQVKEERDEQKKARDAGKEADAQLSSAVARDTGLERGLMIVSMRAAILDDNLAHSNQLLTTLQALQAASKDEKEGSVSQSVYIQIVGEMYRHAKSLKEGLPKTQAVLDKTVKSYVAFLDQLSAKVLSNQPPADMIFFLTNAYSSLDKHAEAGNLVKRIPDPGEKGDDKAKLLYRQAQLLSLKELRLGKQFDDASKLLAKIRVNDWASRSIQVDEEAAALYEDWGKFGLATKAWSEMIGKILKDQKAMQNPKVKEQYYEAYYKYVFCLSKHAATQPVGKQQEFLVRAAKAMLKVEETQPDYGKEGLKEKYMELLKTDAGLKKEYDTLKAAAPKT